VEDRNNFYLGKPLTLVLKLDLSSSNVKKGGFKLAAFGTSMTAVFNGDGAEAICVKCAYYVAEQVVEVGGLLTKKTVNVSYDGEKQFQLLMMEVSCLVWAQALLNIIYDFVEVEKDCRNLPFHIPQLRFVNTAIAIEQSPSAPSQKKTTFLLEEVINTNTDRPFRKYLNNISAEPLMQDTKEDEEQVTFLTFSQHVQYWKTKKQVFVSDYQGKQPTLNV